MILALNGSGVLSRTYDSQNSLKSGLLSSNILVTLLAVTDIFTLLGDSSSKDIVNLSLLLAHKASPFFIKDPPVYANNYINYILVRNIILTMAIVTSLI